jgi:hypothetical protein
VPRVLRGVHGAEGLGGVRIGAGERHDHGWSERHAPGVPGFAARRPRAWEWAREPLKSAEIAITKPGPPKREGHPRVWLLPPVVRRDANATRHHAGVTHLPQEHDQAPCTLPSFANAWPRPVVSSSKKRENREAVSGDEES